MPPRTGDECVTRVVAVFAAAAILLLGAACGGSGGARSTVTTPEAAVLGLGDLPSGYRKGDDTGCGLVGSTEGSDPHLDALFRLDRPHACSIELVRVWAGGTGPGTVTSVAFVFSDAASAKRAFAQRLGLVNHYAAALGQDSARRQTLGDEAWLVQGRGANHPAAGVIWRTGRIVAALVTEPADVSVARRLARLQERRIEGRQPPAPKPTDTVELALNDPALTRPVYWLGRSFDAPGSLPDLALRDAWVIRGPAGVGGPGNDVELDYYASVAAVHIAIWQPARWHRFLRTRLGRLVWDSPCAHRTRVTLADGTADIYEGYGTSKQLTRSCPKRPPDTALAHVTLPGVVVAVNIPICFLCVGHDSGNPYNTRAGMEAVVRRLRLRS
jgi:hypothetical protein